MIVTSIIKFHWLYIHESILRIFFPNIICSSIAHAKQLKQPYSGVTDFVMIYPVIVIFKLDSFINTKFNGITNDVCGVVYHTLLPNTILYPVVAGHYSDVIMSTMASQITSLTVVYSTVYPGADQRKHQISTSLAFVRGIHRSPVNSPHKGPVTRKMFPFDDVIMWWKPLRNPSGQQVGSI